MFEGTLRLSANRSVSCWALTVMSRGPHSDLDNSCEKGAVARSPFDIQFISASTTVSVRRSSVGLRVASVSRALIVLRALVSSLLVFLAAQFREFFPTDPDLGAIPRFRPRSFLRRTVTSDGQATKCCLQAFRKSPSYLGPILFISRHRSEPVFRAKKVRENAFFSRVSFNDLSRAQTGDPFSGLSCGGIALQYTDE